MEDVRSSILYSMKLHLWCSLPNNNHLHPPAASPSFWRKKTDWREKKKIIKTDHIIVCSLVHSRFILTYFIRILHRSIDKLCRSLSLFLSSVCTLACNPVDIYCIAFLFTFRARKRWEGVSDGSLRTRYSSFILSRASCVFVFMAIASSSSSCIPELKAHSHIFIVLLVLLFLHFSSTLALFKCVRVLTFVYAF